MLIETFQQRFRRKASANKVLSFLDSKSIRYDPGDSPIVLAFTDDAAVFIVESSVVLCCDYCAFITHIHISSKLVLALYNFYRCRRN